MRMHRKSTNKNTVINICLFCLIIIILALIRIGWPLSHDEKKVTVHEEVLKPSQISQICELATLRCYYHNVAELEKQPDVPFQYGLFQYGYKKLWMEYSGIVEVGIEASDIKISTPDEAGNIRIYIPDAKIFNVTADQNSLTEPLVETGKFTEISAEDKAQAFSDAQQKMRAEAEADKSILSQAKNNAKEIIKQNIVSIGKLTGNQYNIIWEDKEETIEQ